MRIYPSTKTVLRIRNNAAQFLNGLTSNILEQPYNAFLTIHGRIVATFDQLKTGEAQLLICVENKYVEAVLRHVERYLKLSKTEMTRENTAVYFDLDAEYKPGADEEVIPQKKGQLVITSKTLESTVSSEEFTRFRLINGIPLQGVDYTDEFLLNVSDMEFVSYTKGCFLGQEPVAKVHNRSKPTWKLAVRYEDECSDEEKAKMTSKMTDLRTGRVQGFVFVNNT